MNKSKDMVWITIAYILALFAGGASFYLFDHSPLVKALLAGAIAMLVIFIFSRRFNNSSFFDPYWSVLPPLLALYWLAVSTIDAPPARQLLVLGLVLFWATRLTLNWAYYWEGMQHEDWRYRMLKDRSGRWEILVDLFGIHCLPMLLVFLALLPVYAVYCLGERPLGWLDAVATLVTASAISVEMLADLQLHRFTRQRQEGEQLDQGLWGWSRHPNYFGEIGFWFGLLLFGLAAYPEGWYWQIVGIIAMTAMFVFASIPTMERRSLERRPDYQQVIDSVSMLVPWPPRRKPPNTVH